MNRLPIDRQAQAIRSLVEGNSIRSTERMTGIHRDTVMRLLVSVGENCQAIMNTNMQSLSCKRVQVDEIWTYVGKKQKNVTSSDDRAQVGDMWTYVALDADTKLVPSFLVGKREAENTKAFIPDLSDRLVNRIHLPPPCRSITAKRCLSYL